MPLRKKGSKFKYRLTFGACTGLPDGAFCCLSWKRGAKSENHGETKQKMVFDNKVEWNETTSLICTLFPDGARGYDEKSIVVTVNEFNVKKKKMVPLGLAKINLSEFANLNGASRAVTISLRPAKKKKEGVYDLGVTVCCESTAEEGDEDQTDVLSSAPAGADAFDSEDEQPPELKDHKDGDEDDEGGSRGGGSDASGDEGSAAPAKKAPAVSAPASSPPASSAPGVEDSSSTSSAGKSKGHKLSVKVAKHKKDKGKDSADTEALRADLERAQADIARARERDEAKSAELRATCEERDRLAQSLAESERECDDLGRRLEAVQGGDSAALRDELTEVTEELRETRERAATSQGDAAKARAEAEASRRRVAELEEEVALCKRQLAAVKGGDAALRADAERLREELQAAHERDARVDAELRRLRDEVARERKRASDQEEEAMFAKRRIKDLEGRPAGVVAAQAPVDRDDSLEKEAESLRRRNRELEKQVQQQKSRKLEAAAIADAAIGAEAAAAAEARLRFTQDVMRAFLENRYEQTGRPAASTVIEMFLEKPACEDALAYACEIFTSARKTSADNVRGCVYWLATAWWLVKDLTTKLSSRKASPPTVIKKPRNEPDSESQGDITLHELHLFLFDAFGRALEHPYEALGQLLYPVVVESEPSGPRSRRTGGGMRSSRNNPAAIIALLTETSQALKAGNLPPAVRLQYFTQICNFVNATLFNMLVTQPSLCTCSTGLQVKMGLSHIEEWVGREKEIAAAKARLDQIREVSNLLVVMDKTILLDDTLTKTMFPSLEIVQLSHFIHAFQTDEVCKTAMDPNVMSAVQQRAQSSGDAPLELDPHAFIDPDS